MSEAAWELLSDFRQVEENFRRLDRQLRKKITGWQGGKGELLDDVLGSRESIAGSEGYAYLRQRPADDEETGQLPRLVPRRSLSFHVSLLLALLRKKLAEFDAQGGDTRLMLTRAQIVEMLRVFLPETSSEARLVDQIDAHIGKAADLGFLRPVKNAEQLYEVRRILKAYIDGQWLADFSGRIAGWRRRSLPAITAAIARHAQVHVLRTPAEVRGFLTAAES